MTKPQSPGAPNHRIFAIQGDLYDPQPVLSEAARSGFDAVVISFALHHTRRPRGYADGTVIVLESSRHSHDTASAGHAGEEVQKYRAEYMVKLRQGMKRWAGFTMQDIQSDMASAGCVDV